MADWFYIKEVKALPCLRDCLSYLGLLPGVRDEFFGSSVDCFPICSAVRYVWAIPDQLVRGNYLCYAGHWFCFTALCVLQHRVGDDFYKNVSLSTFPQSGRWDPGAGVICLTTGEIWGPVPGVTQWIPKRKASNIPPPPKFCIKDCR